MGRLIEKVEDLLRRAFPRCAVDLDWTPSTAKPIHGFLVWKGFDGVDEEMRVAQLFDALKSALSEAERARVSMIFPLTPLEMQIREEDKLREDEAILASAAEIRRERRRKHRRDQQRAARARPVAPSRPVTNGHPRKSGRAHAAVAS